MPEDLKWRSAVGFECFPPGSESYRTLTKVGYHLVARRRPCTLGGHSPLSSEWRELPDDGHPSVYKGDDPHMTTTINDSRTHRVTKARTRCSST